MGGGQGLGHGGHARRVAAQDAKGPYLSRCLKLRASAVAVYPLLEGDARLVRRVTGHLAQGGGIHMAHIKEARAKLRKIAPPGGAGPEQVDVVGDEHDVALSESLVDAASRVGEDDGLHSQQLEHPDRHHQFLEIIALVVVEAAREAHHLPPRQLAENQLSCVGLHGGEEEVRLLFNGI